jgi:hypothetical protein
MATIYDSAWVPATSGAINAAVNLDGTTQVKITLAASGSGGASGSIGWSAGSDSPIPWMSAPRNKTPAYPINPKITGSYSIGIPPAINDYHSYYIGMNLSGVGYPASSGTGGGILDTFVPHAVYVNLVVSASSWGRVIVEGY